MIYKSHLQGLAAIC